MIITIDGPAGSGKSTVANLISEKLGFERLDSGSLFRGATAHLLDNNFDFSTITQSSDLPNFNFELKYQDNNKLVIVNDIDYTSRLRDVNVSNNVSILAKNKNFRKNLDLFQRQYAQGRNIVVDGRDTGSHVYPNAEYKFYLDCAVEERAKRRYNEHLSKGEDVDYQDILDEMIKRDYNDKTREVAPLIIPDNAIIIDSTNMSITQVVDTILSQIN